MLFKFKNKGDFYGKVFYAPFEILRKKEETNSIVIWPDVPYWLYLDEFTTKVIQVISQFSEYNELIKSLHTLFPNSIIDKQIKDLFDELHYARVITFPGETEVIEPTYYVIRTVTMNITDVCNLFCKHCYIDSSSHGTQFMSLDQAKLVVDTIYPYMTPSCSFIVSGGEALLNPACIDILKYISSRGKGKITLVTTEQLLHLKLLKNSEKSIVYPFRFHSMVLPRMYMRTFVAKVLLKGPFVEYNC